MGRQRIATGSPFEQLASYSRAVVDGDMVYVSGTVGLDYATRRMPDGAVAQTEQAFRNIEGALAQAGASLADVLRVRVFIADRADLMPVCEVVGRHFRDIRPANTTVVSALATPEMKVEIEVTARRGSADPPAGGGERRAAAGRPESPPRPATPGSAGPGATTREGTSRPPASGRPAGQRPASPSAATRGAPPRQPAAGRPAARESAPGPSTTGRPASQRPAAGGASTGRPVTRRPPATTRRAATRRARGR
jgi:enamine deaminase RidA (YjgF/YER057c/UK114 family)